MVAVPNSAEVRRILDRYLVEVVEAYDLCPWARSARLAGEIAVAILGGTPTDAAWNAACHRALAQPGARVAMVVAPDLSIDRAAFSELRDRVAARIPHAGIAEFHPDAPLDLASPARLVPFIRRSPDPMLQLVSLEILRTVRAPPVASLAEQAQILTGNAKPTEDLAARIARVNHATVSQHAARIAEILDDIARDRATAYSASP
jgi:hypothetical protein